MIEKFGAKLAQIFVTLNGSISKKQKNCSGSAEIPRELRDLCAPTTNVQK